MELLLVFVLGLVSQEYAFGTKPSCSPEGAVELQGSGAKSVITCTCHGEVNHNATWRVGHEGVVTCTSDGVCSTFKNGFKGTKTYDGNSTELTMTIDGSKVVDHFRGQSLTLKVGHQTGVVFQIDFIRKPRLQTRKSRDLRVINYVDGPLFLDFCFDAYPEPTASPVTYDGSRKTDTSARATFMTVCSNLSVAGCSVICKVIVNDVASKAGEGIYTFHVQNSLGREDVRFRVETSGASKTTSTWSIVGGVLSVIAVAVIVCFLIYLLITKKRHKYRRTTRSRRDTDSTSGSAITATTSAPSPRHSAIVQGFPPEFERNESLGRSSGLRRAHSVSVISRSMHEQVWSSDRPAVLRSSRVPHDYYNTAAFPHAASLDNETLSVFNFSTGSLLATEAHQTQPKAIYPRLPTNMNVDEPRAPAARNNPSGHYDSAEPHETVPKTVASRPASTSSLDDIDGKEANGSHGNIDNLWVGNFSDYGSSDSLETRPKYVYSSQTLVKGSNA